MLSIDFHANHHPWRNLKVSAKAFYCFCIFVLSYLWPTPIVFLCVASVSILILKQSTYLRLSTILKTWLFLMSFLCVGVLGVLITYHLDQEMMLVSFRFSSGFVGINQEGLKEASQLFFRSSTCYVVLYTYVLITPIEDTMKLLKKFRIPSTFIEILEISYRFIFIFLEEVLLIHASQKLRLGYHSKKTSFRSMGILVGTLFTRVFEKTEKMHQSMQLRQGEG